MALSESLREAVERLRLVEQALASVVWRELLLPELQRRYQHHVELACARDLTPEKRAEHIEAIALAADLQDWLEAKKRHLEQEITRHQKK